MKHLTILTFLLFWVNFSCNSIANKSTPRAFKILKTETFKNYKFVTFTNYSDTILGVAKKDVSEKCISKQISNFQTKNDFEEVKLLNDEGDTIFFSYRIGSLNPSIKKIYAGSGAPGPSNKADFYSYNSFPILLKSCN